MKRLRRIHSAFVRRRSAWRRRRRIVFPSPAELALVRLMGGRAITFPLLRDPRTHFPIALYVGLGRFLKSEGVAREVRVGSKYVDFGNDIHRAIEVMSDEWHKDIVAEQDRLEYLETYGWQILYVWASDIRDRPALTRERVTLFLTK